MRPSLLAAVSTVAGLAACAPVTPYSYGYTSVGTVQPAPYYDYQPEPYYPGYAAPYAAPYVSPGPAVVIGGGRVFRNDDRYRYERERYDRDRYDRGYRGRPPNREVGRPPPGPQNFGGGRPGPGPGPGPVAVPRPGPIGPAAPPPSPGPGGHAPSFNPANPTAQGDRG